MNRKALFGKWITELFQDERDLVSVKPVIAIAGAVFLIASMMISLFVHLDPSTALVDGVVIITCVGMGADSLDKFSLKKKDTHSKEPEV